MKSSKRIHREQEWGNVVELFKQEQVKNPYLTQQDFEQKIIPASYPELSWVSSKNLSKWINKLYNGNKRRKFFTEEEKVLFVLEWLNGRVEGIPLNADNEIYEDNNIDYSVFASYCREKGACRQTAYEWRNNPRYRAATALVTNQSTKPNFTFTIYPDRQKWDTKAVNTACMHLDPTYGKKNVKVVAHSEYNYSLVAKKSLSRDETICIFSTEFADKPPPNDWYSFKFGRNKHAVVSNKDSAHYGMFMNDSLDEDGNNARIGIITTHGEEIAVVKACRKISKGEPICLAYGQDYWVNFFARFHADNALKEQVNIYYSLVVS